LIDGEYLMHVVHLYDGHEQIHEGRGSVPGVVWNIARETVAAGHEVTVLERQWDGLPASGEHDGVTFQRLDLWTGTDEPWTRVPYEVVTSPNGFLRLVGDRTNFAVSALRRLHDMDFDVLHVHLPFAANVIASVAPWLRDQIVYTAHLGELRLDILEEEQKNNSETSLDVPSILTAFSPDVYLAKRVLKTTVLNSNIKSVFAERGVPESALQVVANGVDIKRFSDIDPTTVQRVRAKYGIGDHPSILFVGTVMPRKGVTELVQALDQIVNESDRNIDAILAGDTNLDTSYVERVEKLISRTGLDANVTMPGFVPAEDLPALYQAVDLFVVPSLEEGFGMTAIEAMAAGTPVVGTRVGGLPDIIDPGRTGELVDPGDITGIASAIERVLETICDTETQVKTATQSRAREYSWVSVTQDFTDIYEEVVT
jgi:glycosyltransferase involved in cell wall biosynthesis